MSRKKEKLIIGKVRSVKGYPTQIFDEENNHIADVEVRSWGRLQYMEEGDKMHTQLSEFIQDAINEKMEKMGIKVLDKNDNKEQEARDYLTELGFYTSNLWQLNDIQEYVDGKIDEDTAMSILHHAMENEATYAQIWLSIEHAKELKISK